MTGQATGAAPVGQKATGEITIGSHLSMARGYAAMGREALRLGANTFAFFTRNPRGGSAKPLDPSDVAALRDILSQNDFGTLVAHAPYTLNLCSAKPDVVSFGRRALAEDIARMEELPGSYLNFHPGSHVGQGVDRGIELIAEGLNEALVPGQTTTVLLETMAGKGTEVGRSFEELERIIELVDHDELVGVCLDTCHVWDAGYDIVGDLGGVLDEFDRVIGLGCLKALHVNDSKNARGSHKDRHEKIGQGHIGLDAFAAIVREPRLTGLPMILETPNKPDGYRREIALLRALARGEDVADARTAADEPATEGER